MSRSLLSIFLFSFLTVGVFADPMHSDAESRLVGTAMSTLDHFMQAGSYGKHKRGAALLDQFDINPRRAEYDTRLLYRKREKLFSGYVSIANDIYGYEVKRGLSVTSFEVEGGVETAAGVTAEFAARLILRDKKWRIVKIEID